MAGPRKCPPLPFGMGKGLFMDATARGAIRRWKDGENVRWHAGLPQPIGGFEEYPVWFEEDDPDTDPARLYVGRARSWHEWDSLDGQNWVAFGTHCKLYLVN